MNKWFARFILLFVILFLLWVYYKKKNGLLKIPKTSKLSKFHDSVFNIAFSLIDYAQYKEDSHEPTQKQTRWKMEHKCREILQRIFHVDFPSSRPDFLKSPMTGHNLELDCFNPNLKLALEYNGKQHYTYTPYFHKSKRDFYAQVHRDNWKREKCQMNGITLIEVPHHVPENKLEPFIREQLSLRGFNTPQN